MNPRLFDRLAATLSVLLLLVLAGGSYYLAELAKRQDVARPIDKTVHELDAFVERFSLTRIDADGQAAYRLEAERAEHFPDDGSVELYKLRGVSLRTEQPPLSISAERGRTDNEVKVIDLRGNVVVRRAGRDREEPDLVVETEAAQVLTDPEIARTDQPVKVTQGSSFLTGVGMELNNAERTLHVLSQVRGRFSDAASSR